VPSSTPRGSVSCLLCKGSVSVRAGNLEKFKVHVESDHDVFYDHDILIAINFLEAHEKEVIIEKVLPRMRMIFNEVSFSNRKTSIDDKLAIEKRLLEKDGEDEELETLDHAPKKAKYADRENESSKIQRKEEINLEDSEDEDEKNDEKREERDMPLASETLTENIQPTGILQNQSDSAGEFSDCDVCHQSIRKSVLDFHRKSHFSEAKANVECQHCGKVMQKTSMWRHMKSRCPTLLKLGKPISEETPDVPVASEQMVAPESFQCKICFTNFQRLGSLKMHTTEEHSLDLEDVEQMLSESQENVKETTHKTENKASVKLDPEILEKMKATEYNEPGNEKFKCRYCDNVFTKKNNARRHEKRTHPEYVSSRHSMNE